MKIRFTKMHGLGNDFMVIDGVRQAFKPNADLIRQWANRHTGIGFDQLLIAEKAQSEQADFRYRIFNSDGGEVGQCGNGARCLARFLHEENLTTKNPVIVETKTGLIELKREEHDQVKVSIGRPVFTPEKIPFSVKEQAITYLIRVNDQMVQACVLSVGNPHCVLTVENIDTAPVETWGALLTKHACFPEEANIEFMQIIDRNHIRLRVYERGAGETQACGSGACAAVVAGRILNLLDETVTVELPGGHLIVNWQGDQSSVYLTGPAISVFTGSVNIDH